MVDIVDCDDVLIKGGARYAQAETLVGLGVLSEPVSAVIHLGDMKDCYNYFEAKLM